MNKTLFERLERWAEPQRTIGGCIYLQDAEPDGFYLVRSGHVRLARCQEDGRELLLRLAGPGDVFGVPEAITGARRLTSASARMPVVIRRVPIPALRRIEAEEPALAFDLYQDALDDAQTLERRLADQMMARAFEKTAVALLTLLESAKSALLHVTHADIAAMAGVSRETVTRMLCRMDELGAVRTKTGLVKILDPGMLARLATGAAV